MSEFEQPERLEREPTIEDVRQLMGASTPHFALQLRNRIFMLVSRLPAGHPVRVEGEREIRRLNAIAFDGERRGPDIGDLPDMPSVAAGTAEAGPARASSAEAGPARR
jgi:hypothetical protein